MAEYMLDIYKIRRFANGHVTSEKVSKVLKESTVNMRNELTKTLVISMSDAIKICTATIIPSMNARTKSYPIPNVKFIISKYSQN